jgi:hypothetical protein
VFMQLLVLLDPLLRAIVVLSSMVRIAVPTYEARKAMPSARSEPELPASRRVAAGLTYLLAASLLKRAEKEIEPA